MGGEGHARRDAMQDAKHRHAPRYCEYSQRRSAPVPCGQHRADFSDAVGQWLAPSLRAGRWPGAHAVVAGACVRNAGTKWHALIGIFASPIREPMGAIAGRLSLY